MIDVSVSLGKRLSVKLRGHAGGEQGQDLVCASASILAYTLAQNIKDGEQFCETLKIRLDEGDTEISCKPKPESLNAVRGIYLAFIRGFQLLEANFPDKVSVRRGDPKHK